MKFVKISTLEKAQDFINKLQALQPKTIWGHSSDANWYTFEEPKHSAGDGHWWIKETITPMASMQPYDGAFGVQYHEAFEKEAQEILAQP